MRMRPEPRKWSENVLSAGQCLFFTKSPKLIYGRKPRATYKTGLTYLPCGCCYTLVFAERFAMCRLNRIY